MPRGLTSTCLPASRVARACQCALDSIESETEAFRVSLILIQRTTRGFRAWGKSDETVWENAPVEIRKMVELYRAKDIDVLRSIQALAKAAIYINGDFTVEVTADDFRLFHKWYIPLTKSA